MSTSTISDEFATLSTDLRSLSLCSLSFCIPFPFRSIRFPFHFRSLSGTLLGGIRESSLLAHEFDLDLAAREEECPKIIAALKDKVKTDGYHAYERGEWIEQKYKSVTDTECAAS